MVRELHLPVGFNAAEAALVLLNYYYAASGPTALVGPRHAGPDSNLLSETMSERILAPKRRHLKTAATTPLKTLPFEDAAAEAAEGDVTAAGDAEDIVSRRR